MEGWSPRATWKLRWVPGAPHSVASLLSEKLHQLGWRHAPRDYAAIHFHKDDLGDCGWQVDFTWTVPDDLASGACFKSVPFSARLGAAVGGPRLLACPVVVRVLLAIGVGAAPVLAGKELLAVGVNSSSCSRRRGRARTATWPCARSAHCVGVSLYIFVVTSLATMMMVAIVWQGVF